MFCIDIIRTFAIANKLQWRPSAAAQQRPSELASAFALHDGCTVIHERHTKRDSTTRCSWPSRIILIPKTQESMAKIIYEVYQNKNVSSRAYGKHYARVKYLECLNTRKLSNHIAEHGSIYTPDVVYGVMEKFRSCLIEMLLQSKKVKIDGLGTFYCTIECKKGGAVSKDKFNVQKDIQGLHIRFLPEQEQETNISSRQFLKQAEFIHVDSLVKTEDEENGSTSGGSDSGSQGGNGGD